MNQGKPLLIIFLLYSIALFQTTDLIAQPGFGKAEKINSDWFFSLQRDKKIDENSNRDKSWKEVRIPHDWTIKQALSPTLASATGYLPGGIGWYQKEIEIPAEKAAEQVFLYFEGIYNRSEVFVNGKSVGKRPNGYISFSYDISPFIKYGERNVISVKVDHSKDADSRWYTGSGIYRDVWLVYANKVRLGQWGVYAYPELQNGKSELKVQVGLVNETDKLENLSIETELFDPQGNSVSKKVSKTKLGASEKKEVSVQLAVKKPELWTLETPNQYILKTKVLAGNKVLDQSEIKTGFRKITFDPNKGFALNDRWMKVKGVCIHHDAGVLGSEFYPEVWRRRLMTLKEVGVNAIRTSHNPQASSLYALCDELGILVLNEAYDEWEFPKRKWLEGWNEGVPGFQSSTDFFGEWGEKDLIDMVKRDRNHISIFAWSIGNEVDYPNDPYSHPILDGKKEGGFTQAIYGGYKKDAPDANRLGAIAKKLAAAVRLYDKSRPVTAGLAGVAMSNETEYPDALDIAGYNYTEGKYKEDHVTYPNRVIYGSENRHDLEAWKAVQDNDFIFGQFLWTGIDYLGESRKWPSRGFYSGLMDFAGFIKPRGYIRQSLWAEKPMAYLGTYPIRQNEDGLDKWNAQENKYLPNPAGAPWMDALPNWNYKEGQLIRVVGYSNAPNALLLLNGEQIGSIKTYDTKTGIYFWDVPFKEGKLEIVGLDKDENRVSHAEIKTSGPAKRIKIIGPDLIEINKNDGIAQVVLQIQDQEGNDAFLAENEITCHILGDVRLLGMEAGNNTDMADYTDNRQRVFHGKMIVYLQAKPESTNSAFVKFSSDWLDAAELEIKFK